MNEGIHNSIVSNLNLALKKVFSLDKEFTNIVVSISYAGMFLGSVTAGIISNKFGRWKVLFWASILHYAFGFC